MKETKTVTGMIDVGDETVITIRTVDIQINIKTLCFSAPGIFFCIQSLHTHCFLISHQQSQLQFSLAPHQQSQLFFSLYSFKQTNQNHDAYTVCRWLRRRSPLYVGTQGQCFHHPLHFPGVQMWLHLGGRLWFVGSL